MYLYNTSRRVQSAHDGGIRNSGLKLTSLFVEGDKLMNPPNLLTRLGREILIALECWVLLGQLWRSIHTSSVLRRWRKRLIQHLVLRVL
jgi:hypothetical protein